MAATGYPGAPEKGGAIRRIADAEAGDVRVFHAGTARADGTIVAPGGRVLNVTATGNSLNEAHARAHAAVDRTHLPLRYIHRALGWSEAAHTAKQRPPFTIPHKHT